MRFLEDVVLVILRCRGTTWPAVWPAVLANTFQAAIVVACKTYGVVDLGIEMTGHSVASALVAFFVVTRTNQSCARYFEGRTVLGCAFMYLRDLVAASCFWSRDYADEREAAAWRYRIVRAAIQAAQAVLASVHNENNSSKLSWSRVHQMKTLYSVPGEYVELRKIANEAALHVQARVHLDRACQEFMYKVAATSKLVNTPLPFPVVHMSRTLIFAWVFTLPYALVTTMSVFTPIFVFFLTFAFVGLEWLAASLDDPFGDDEIDIDVIGLAQQTIADLCAILDDVDGPGTSISLIEESVVPRKADTEAATSATKRFLLSDLVPQFLHARCPAGPSERSGLLQLAEATKAGAA